MKYNFDTIINRRGTNSVKWEVEEHELPMWVADMDFEVAPEIREALANRLSHGIYGYSILPESWADAYSDWWAVRHHYRMEKKGLLFCTGVIPALSSIIRKLTTPAENVLLQTPVYNHFFTSVQNNGRRVKESPLSYDGQNYSMDFERLEADLADPQTTLMILCNPHNPIGKLWDKETLATVGELCKKHHVTVISDEIHCDITAPGTEYVPFASVSDTCREISVTCIAPTKTFNIAGLHTSAVYAADENLRHKVQQAFRTDEVGEPNAFAVDAAVAAFTRGGDWLAEMREYVQGNKELVKEYLSEHLPELYVVPSEATYLLWVDCRMLTNDSKVFAKEIRDKTGLYLSEGGQYGDPGKQFLRWNVACPRAVVLDGLKRLEQAIRQ